ncbi:MAG: gliding motility protein GldN [Saprospiraceae bacterium]|nr:gliding motility protein GldN [Saprospiraceae bacterium]MBP7699176.1 gliding motility protein GldN [Saprospiraceae bacterium]
MEEQRPTREPDADRPLDDVVEKRMIKERRVLPYEPIREADIMWEKRVWRVIDTREKINLSFVYPEELFYKILYDAAIKGEIKTYSTEDDKFSYKLEPNEVASMGASIDTVVTVDPETYEEKIKIVRNELDPENVKRFRLKEVWFFDRESSTLKVRILGIAPLMNEYDSNGNFKFERPLFWVYYPECREVFSRHQVFNIEGNDAAPMTWEDLFEARLFSSFITKESNVYNRKLDMYLTGVDMLIEGEKIKEEIFNFEHDLWSY